MKHWKVCLLAACLLLAAAGCTGTKEAAPEPESAAQSAAAPEERAITAAETADITAEADTPEPETAPDAPPEEAPPQETPPAQENAAPPAEPPAETPHTDTMAAEASGTQNGSAQEESAMQAEAPAAEPPDAPAAEQEKATGWNHDHDSDPYYQGEKPGYVYDPFKHIYVSESQVVPVEPEQTPQILSDESMGKDFSELTNEERIALLRAALESPYLTEEQKEDILRTIEELGG